jgi:DNA-binding transcriptional regulator YdaS (Cro superfamily)
MKTHEYMQAIKAALNIESDYALAKKLGVSQPSVSKWRQGKSGIGD